MWQQQTKNVTANQKTQQWILTPNDDLAFLFCVNDAMLSIFGVIRKYLLVCFFTNLLFLFRMSFFLNLLLLFQICFHFFPIYYSFFFLRILCHFPQFAIFSPQICRHVYENLLRRLLICWYTLDSRRSCYASKFLSEYVLFSSLIKLL